jgi:hypothetical protein
MAIERVRFAARHGHHLMFAQTNQSFESLLKKGRFPDGLIIDATGLIVYVPISGPAAEEVAEKDVGDASPSEVPF